jgi:hypothetical protein
MKHHLFKVSKRSTFNFDNSPKVEIRRKPDPILQLKIASGQIEKKIQGYF